MKSTSRQKDFHITEQGLTAFISGRILERGRDYVEDGRVLEVRQAGDRMHAKVLGSEEDEWQVEVWQDAKSGWDGSCTCPYTAGPCKHIAATLLTLLEEPDVIITESEASAESPRRPIDDDELRAKVRELQREDLEGLLIEQAGRDPFLRQRLVLKVKQSEGKPINLASYRTQMRQALAWRGDFIPYAAVPDFVQGLEEMKRSFRDLAAEGHPAEAAELLEEFIDRCIPRIERLDDSGGFFGPFVQDLYSALGEVLSRVPERDPKLWARKTLKRLDSNHYGFEDNLLHDMAGALGPQGLKIIEKEIVRRYEKVRKETVKYAEPELLKQVGSPGWKLNGMLCDLADIRNDVDVFIALKEELGIHPSHCADIAKRLRDAGRQPEALSWVEKGLELTKPSGFDQDGLVGLKIEVLEKLGRRSDACEEAWTEYRRFPNRSALEQALSLSSENNSGRLKQEAIEALVKKGDLAALIDICLPDKNAGPIAEVIRSRKHPFEHLHYSQLQPAALALEKEFPEEAATIYLHLADEILTSKRAKAYVYAIEYYGRIKVLWNRVGKRTEWEQLTETIRKEHRLKSSFLPDFESLCAKG